MEATIEKIPHPVGDSVPRVDAHEKVTGAAIFADDIQFGPGMLYARIVRSPHPHALIKSINVEKAKKLPGVKAIVTGEEFPGLTGLYLSDRYIFARDRVRYVGDPVAGVAAISEEIAEQAVESDRGGVRSAATGARSGIRREPRSAAAPS